ncbi:MAG: transcriptional repressor [Nitrospirae bacterium]|nr:MAG: transcriptional repressor [Nitrospirota bacterium]
MNRVIEKYRASGLKLTPQRLAILKHLEGNKDHPSAEEIFRSVQKQFRTMSFATVYNTLELLVSRGDLAELSIDAAKKRFDPDSRPHHHLICKRCSSIVDIFQDFDIELPKTLKSEFRVFGHHIEFYGLCPRCSGNQQAGNH